MLNHPFFTTGVSLSGVSVGTAVISSFGLSALYVGSLYLVTPRRSCPEDPLVIKRRIIAVCATTTIAPAILWMLGTANPVQPTVLEHVGFTSDNCIKGALLPLALNGLLFLGPLVQRFFDGDFTAAVFKSVHFDWDFLKCFVIAPVTEEIVYRGCMVPLLLPCLGNTRMLYWCTPLVFGVAHLHHLLEGRNPVAVAVQFGFTTVFGAFMTYVFACTGNIYGPIACHAFSNLMGFPDFGSIAGHHREVALKITYSLGLIGFLGLLRPFSTLFLSS
eukprot:m.56272 g.56272  ORF g.56272 m.56272 type:complete len:274 (-) comp15576_c0_seq4:250-1071(-)